MGGRRIGTAAVAEYLEASRAGWKHLTSEPTATRVGPEIVVVHKLHGHPPRRHPARGRSHRRLPLPRGTDRPHARLRGTEEAFAAAPLRRWIDGYRDAWETNDPDAVASLFTPDGFYRIEPWWILNGREEIVKGWLDHADQPGDTSFDWWHVARDGDLWIVEARTRYHNLGKDYSNLWLIDLDDEGRARGFTEWWKQWPDDAGG